MKLYRFFQSLEPKVTEKMSFLPWSRIAFAARKGLIIARRVWVGLADAFENEFEGDCPQNA